MHNETYRPNVKESFEKCNKCRLCGLKGTTLIWDLPFDTWRCKFKTSILRWRHISVVFHYDGDFSTWTLLFFSSFWCLYSNNVVVWLLNGTKTFSKQDGIIFSRKWVTLIAERLSLHVAGNISLNNWLNEETACRTSWVDASFKTKEKKLNYKNHVNQVIFSLGAS